MQHSCHSCRVRQQSAVRTECGRTCFALQQHQQQHSGCFKGEISTSSVSSPRTSNADGNTQETDKKPVKATPKTAAHTVYVTLHKRLKQHSRVQPRIAPRKPRCRRAINLHCAVHSSLSDTQVAMWCTHHIKVQYGHVNTQHTKFTNNLVHAHACIQDVAELANTLTHSPTPV